MDCDSDFGKRRIYVGDISPETAYSTLSTMNAMAQEDYSPISLLINSDGGEISSALSIIDEIEAFKKEGIVIETLNLACAYSAAAFILSCGTKGHRFGKPSSTVMLHKVSSSLDESYEEHNKQCLDFSCKQSKRMYRIISENCNVTFRKFEKDIEKCLWLTSEDAIKYGIIDAVWTKPIFLRSVDNEKNSLERAGD